MSKPARPPIISRARDPPPSSLVRTFLTGSLGSFFFLVPHHCLSRDLDYTLVWDCQPGIKTRYVFVYFFSLGTLDYLGRLRLRNTLRYLATVVSFLCVCVCGGESLLVGCIGRNPGYWIRFIPMLPGTPGRVFSGRSTEQCTQHPPHLPSLP